MSDTLFVGKNNIFLAETDSTQTFATILLSKTTPSDGTCIRTDFQSAGKGQIGRYWHSAAGKNLLLSYVLYPTFLDIEDVFFLNIIGSLAIVDLCHELNIEAKIKWPNDVYIENKKLAGILSQNTFTGQTIKSTIMGIGLNVNEIDFPDNLPNPISLRQITGQHHSVVAVNNILSQKLEFRYLELRSGKTSELWINYHNALYRKGEWNYFKNQNGNLFKGKIQGINKRGQLLVKTDTAIEAYNLNEIDYLIDNE